MQTKIEASQQSTRLQWIIILAGACLGFMLTAGVLSGDAQGRVNLFYLLLVFLFIPFLSILISLFSLFFSKGVNLARLLNSVPFLKLQSTPLARKVHQMGLDKPWFFLQSQAAAFAFSIACLLVFFLLLLVTDINFVWRSTLLSAEDIIAFLELIASPWQFIPAAQPSVELLASTQDSRLIVAGNSPSAYAAWWPFILATQICYSLIPRGILFLLASWLFRRAAARDVESSLALQMRNRDRSKAEQQQTKPLVDTLPQSITVNNWAGVELDCLKTIENLQFDSDNLLLAGPLASDAEQRVAERWQGPQLVLVKAWEPPMGELADFLENGRGLIFPLEFNSQRLEKPRAQHIAEWQRFTNKLTNWQVFLPKSLQPDLEDENS